jgi:hypothetical protein
MGCTVCALLHGKGRLPNGPIGGSTWVRNTRTMGGLDFIEDDQELEVSRHWNDL